MSLPKLRLPNGQLIHEELSRDPDTEGPSVDLSIPGGPIGEVLPVDVQPVVNQKYGIDIKTAPPPTVLEEKYNQLWDFVEDIDPTDEIEYTSLQMQIDVFDTPPATQTPQQEWDMEQLAKVGIDLRAGKPDTIADNQAIDLKTTTKWGDVLKPDPTTGAIKADGAKPRMDLVATQPIIDLAEILSFGAEKYGDRNWEAGMAWSRPYASLMRHMLAWWGGETLDKESGKSHLAHAMCNLMFLMEFEHTYTEGDDRP